MVRWLALSLAFAIAVALPEPAAATVVKAMTLEEKTQASPLVVYAAVERVESEWELAGARARTLITVRVLETLKGEAAPGAHLIIRQGGGHIGDFHQTAPGLDAYEEGRECILFLEPVGPYLVTIGFQIGKYEVEDDGAQKWVTYAPNIAELDVRSHTITPAQPMSPEPLKRFLKRIRSYAQGIPIPTVVPRKGVEKKPAPAIPRHLRSPGDSPNDSSSSSPSSSPNDSSRSSPSGSSRGSPSRAPSRSSSEGGR